MEFLVRERHSATKPNHCCAEDDYPSQGNGIKSVFLFHLCFCPFGVVSLECEAFIINRPLGKILFLRKNSLPVSKAILKIFFTQAAYCL